jgi:hypothetical protein
MSPGVATRHAESVRHVEGFGIEEIPGLFSEESDARRTRLLIQRNSFGRRSVQSPFFHGVEAVRRAQEISIVSGCCA